MTIDDVPGGVVAGIAAAVVAAAAAAGWLLYRRYRRRRAVVERIEAVSEAHLQDVILPDGNGGWFHLDFLLLMRGGLLVLDLREMPGMIFGSEHMTEWTVMDKSGRTTFPNPLGALYDRVAVVRQLAGEGVPVEGRVVFGDRSSFPKGQPPLVTRLGQLAADFPPLAHAPSAVDAFREAWGRLEAAATPSPLRRR